MMTRICLFLLFIFSISVSAQENWTPLFNGNDLSGWKILGGVADYSIEGNEIVGRTRGRSNTFLTTEKEYGDFILELEVWVDARMNSGMQFRSAVNEQGRVYGYQAEIDPGPRAYSGGLYDEGRRDWLYPLSLNPKGQKAFVNGQWNKYRIEAIGMDIRIWVNGICTTKLRDDVSPSGFIGLQVHGVPDGQEGREVKWRNIRIATSGVEELSWPTPLDIYELDLTNNGLTESEKRLGWQMLWDGKTTQGWREIHETGFPESRWALENGELRVKSGGQSTSNGVDLVTEKSFRNFELSLQFKLTKGANSGIKYLVNEDLNPEGGAIGLEYQILDNQNHPDAKKGINGNRTIASLYDMIPAENLSYAGMGRRFMRLVGAWNHARIIVKDGWVEHWLNGFKVVEYDRFSPLFKAMVAKSKYKDWPNFGREKSGHIVLQDHGDNVVYRNIKIREF